MPYVPGSVNDKRSPFSMTGMLHRVRVEDFLIKMSRFMSVMQSSHCYTAHTCYDSLRPIPFCEKYMATDLQDRKCAVFHSKVKAHHGVFLGCRWNSSFHGYLSFWPFRDFCSMGVCSLCWPLKSPPNYTYTYSACLLSCFILLRR